MAGSYGRKVALLFAVNIAFYLQNLLLLPILTRRLGVEMYGVWSQVTAASSLLVPIVLLGLPSAFARFAVGVQDKAEIARTYYTILIVILAAAMAAAGLLFCGADVIATSFLQHQSEAVRCYRAAGLLVLGQALSRFSTSYFRTFQRAGVFSAMRLLQPAGTVGSAIVALWLGYGLAGVLVVAAVTHLGIYACSQVLVARDIGFGRPELRLLGPYLAFCLPLLPAGMVNWVTGLSDRYVIGAMLPVTDLGTYSAGYTLGMVVMFFYAPFRVFVLPRGMELWDSGDHRTLQRLLNTSNKLPLLLSIGAVFGALALGDQIQRLMTGSTLESPRLLIPTIAVGYILFYVGTTYSFVFQFVKKTKHIVIAYAVGAVLNVTANVVLIPHLGLMGAAVGTVVAFLAMLIYLRHRARRVFQIQLDWGYLWGALASGGLMYAALVFLSPLGAELGPLPQLILAVGVGSLVYLAGIVLLGAVGREELAFLRQLAPRRD